MSDTNERDKNPYGNLKEKVITTRLETVASATSRTRSTFLIMIVFCATINVALWNGYLSWVRDMAMPKVDSIMELNETKKENSPQTAEIKTEDSSLKKANDNKKVLVDEWIRSQTISFNLLGIKLTTFDLSVLGSIGLVIVMIWYFFVIRRENRTIVPFLKEISDTVQQLKKDKDPQAFELANLVFLGIVNNTVFINVADNDNPSKIFKNDKDEIQITFKRDKLKTIYSLFFIGLTTLSILSAYVAFHLPILGISIVYTYIMASVILFFLIFALVSRIQRKRNETQKLLKYFIKFRKFFIKAFKLTNWWEENKNEAVFFRWIIYLLLFLPSITIFLIILSDLSSLFNFSAYRKPDQLLLQHVIDELPKIIVFELIAFIGFLMTTYLSMRSVNFSKGIKDSLNTFYNEFIIDSKN